mmetsp:Transcript_102726/g.306899  ORF Transcript_102726/g.306899 Transcript_102726/m.306899 type:complete len:211 (-) Transcript_102726:27-659(-)
MGSRPPSPGFANATAGTVKSVAEGPVVELRLPQSMRNSVYVLLPTRSGKGLPHSMQTRPLWSRETTPSEWSEASAAEALLVVPSFSTEVLSRPTRLGCSAALGGAADPACWPEAPTGTSRLCTLFWSSCTSIMAASASSSASTSPSDHTWAGSSEMVHASRPASQAEGPPPPGAERARSCCASRAPRSAAARAMTTSGPAGPARRGWKRR